jgi:hypothetical protein
MNLGRHLEIDVADLEKEAYQKYAPACSLEQNQITVASSKTELKLFPFSIKKNANIYGIMYLGLKNYAAVDKFLKHIAWKRNSVER